MENSIENIEQKIKNNAIIAYLFIVANILFLFSKNNNLLNNSFVKSHTKTAILIHALFGVNTIIFAYFGLGFHGEIMGYSISDIVAISIYLVLFGFMIVGMYKAYNNELFSLGETLNYKNDKKLLDVNSSGNFDEKDKITIIFSKVPFLGFFLYPRYKENKLIENNVKLSLITTVIIMSLYIFGNSNLANLLSLLYIIFIVFSSINLFIKNEVISVNLKKVPNANDISNYVKTLNIYMGNYFSSKKEFPKFEELLKQVILREEKNNKSQINSLNKLNDFKLWKYIIYIPIVNFICLFNLNSKQKIHIINGILISITFIILSLIYSIENKYQLILLIPLVFSIGYLNSSTLNYKVPFLYDIFEMFVGIKKYLINILGKIKKIKNTEKEVNLKVNKKETSK